MTLVMGKNGKGWGVGAKGGGDGEGDVEEDGGEERQLGLGGSRREASAGNSAEI